MWIPPLIWSYEESAEQCHNTVNAENKPLYYIHLYLELFSVISVGNILYNSQQEIFPLERYQAALRV